MRKAKTQEPEGRICIYCNEPVRSRGMCNRHYYRNYKFGDPFHRRVRKSPNRDWIFAALEYGGDDCLIWPFHRGPDGYPSSITIEGVQYRPARFICTAYRGEAPSPKHQAAHSCGRGRDGCLNRHHMVWKTPADNIADKWGHGTMLVGSRHHQAKLMESDVRAIRKSRGEKTRRQLATLYGVGVSTVDNIIDGVTWRHV